MDTIKPKTQNFNARRAPLLILHATQVDWAETNKILLGQTAYEASCHYAISQKGEVIQYLDTSVRAWHAGVSYWNGFTDLNSLSIGIELECVSKDEWFTDPENTFSDVQIEALKKIVPDLLTEHKIKAQDVLSHQDIAPYRRGDPGVNFNWADLAAAGIGAWHGLKPIKDDPVVTNEITIQEFRILLALYGYDPRPNRDGKDFSQVIRAFQTHFLPWNICGKVTEQSIKALQILLDKKYA